jgi:hydrogenase maturation protease
VSETDVVVIGVGNRFRRDAGVGPAVIDRLRSTGLDGAVLAESDGEAAALIQLWNRQRLAILVDAMQADPPHPGRVHRLVVPRPAVERIRAIRAHAADIGSAVETARSTGRQPDRLVVFGIETADLDEGTGLSPAVERAAEAVAREIELEIRASSTREASVA